MQKFTLNSIATVLQRQHGTEQTKRDHQQRFAVMALLSAAGYEFLGVPAGLRSDDPRFAGGIKDFKPWPTRS